MYFDLHRFDFRRADLGVQGRLRLALQLDLLLPEQDLALRVDHLLQQARLRRLGVVDFLFRLQRRLLQLPELRLELHLEDRRLVGETFLLRRVAPEEIVQSRDVRAHALDGMLEALDLGRARGAVFQELEAAFVQDPTARSQFGVGFEGRLRRLGRFHESRLVRQPHALQSTGLLLLRFDVGFQRLDRRLQRTQVLLVFLALHHLLVLAI